MGEFRRATPTYSGRATRASCREETRAASRASQAKEKQGRGYETPAIERDAAATKAGRRIRAAPSGTGTAEKRPLPTPTATEDPEQERLMSDIELPLTAHLEELRTSCSGR